LVAVWDWRTGLIPNWLVLPAVALTGGYRLYQGNWYVVLIWAVLFLIWRVHIIGGGDAKLLMGLFALFPTLQFALLFGGLVLAVSVPLIVIRHWSRQPGKILESIAKTMRSGNPLPSREDLEKHGQRYAWTLCLPGIVYAWWLY
jgi:Flp pilus assembly protein protease CpaA